MTTSPALKLVLTVHGRPARVIGAGPVAVLGSGPGADVRIPDTSVAAVHLRLERVDDRVMATAVAAGVTVDEVPLAVGEAVSAAGRGLAIGPLAVVAAPWDDARAVPTDSLARELMRDLLGEAAPPPPELVVERGPCAGQLRPLPVGARLVIGRGADASWLLLDPEMSRAHVGVARREDGVYAWDIGSKNGALVDGTPLPRGEPGVLVPDGGRLELGRTVLRLRDPAAPALAALERELAAARDSGEQAAVDTRTRDLRRPARPPAPEVPASRWPMVITIVVAALALGLAIVVLATW